METKISYFHPSTGTQFWCYTNNLDEAMELVHTAKEEGFFPKGFTFIYEPAFIN